jgi:lysozyme
MTRRVKRALAALAVLGVLALAGVWLAEPLYRSGRLHFVRPSPGEYPVHGIDVSHHQGTIDWDRVAAEGVGFAYLKATEGSDHFDRRFERNWAEAGRVGIPRGAYHFFTFCTSGGDQAEHFLRVAPPSADALPPAVDVEFGGNCTSWSDLGQIRRELTRFLERLERAWGVQSVLYATSEGHEKIVRHVRGDRPLWIRNIFREPADDAYGGWQIWQYSGNSRLPGITGLVDLNVLHPAETLAGLRRSVTRPAPRQAASP